MLMTAIVFFALAALLGLYLLSFVLQNINTPKGVAFTHGPLAATGLIILIIYAFFHNPSPIISIIIFVLAALGGIMLLFRDITGKSIPKWMAIGHGLTAIVGFVFLIIFTFFS
ncbi:MAG: hypothetical protein WAW86_05165 [Gammaproteobacteria bacterium]